ncbi:MAG: hypothetical protein ACM3XO_06870 [Bacteroidota bacterium]
MNLRSKRAILSILLGVIAGLLMAIFLKPVCWGPLVGVLLGAYLAKASSPQEGAIVGAIVAVPIGIYAFLQIPADPSSKTTFDIIRNVLGLFLGLGLVAAAGALYGSIVGMLFQAIKKKRRSP